MTSIVVVCLLLVYETYHPTHFRQTLVHGGYKYRAVVIYSNQLSLHSSSPHLYFREYLLETSPEYRDLGLERPSCCGWEDGFWIFVVDLTPFEV